ncbi:MAG: PfkB family carbohydrate kinase, partial [Candidatus Thorarchaeota archaeon]
KTYIGSFGDCFREAQTERKQKLVLGTYSEEIWAGSNTWSKSFKNPKLEHVADTCGAGDTLFVSLLVKLMRMNALVRPRTKHIEEAIRYAQAAAHLQCTKYRTYVPSWKEVEDHCTELFNE